MVNKQHKTISVCIFCGSQAGNDQDFAKMAADLGREMAQSRIGLVFGGGRSGLMGSISDSLLIHGGHAVGIIPEFLTGQEIRHKKAQIIVVPDMHTRKRTMFEHADAFCVLPGGLGTLEEFFEIVAWRQLSVHHKPIILANWHGYWDQLVAMSEEIRNGGFAYEPMEELFMVVNEVSEIIPAIQTKLANLVDFPDPGHPNLSET